MSEGRRQPWVLYALIAANLVMFGVELASGASPIAPSPQLLIELGGSYPPRTLHGEWWRLGSSMFLHFGVVHLAMNMLCLYQARVAEQVFGRIGFLVIYLVAGLGGGIASLITNSGNVVVIGASGAVFGVYGAFGAKLLLHRDQFEPDRWLQTTRRLGQFLAINAVIGIAAPGISISAHIGGFVVGVGLGAALLVGASAERTRTQRALGLAILGVALTAAGLMSMKADADVYPLLQRFDRVEKAWVDQQNAAIARSKAGETETTESIERVEREVITPYRQVRQDLLATADIPVRLRPLFARIDELMTARLASRDAYKAAAREQDPAKQAALVEAYQRQEAEVAIRVAAVTAEVRRDKP
ncbi:MAG TPA: rhomboid family intramembrane serine protease [Kofleriaceae bacterium]